MKQEIIQLLVKEGKLIPKQTNKEKVKSLIASAESNAETIMGWGINETKATIIFREIYESLRQIGEALWILEGYEPNPNRAYHETCLAIIKDSEISHSVKLNHIDRYRKIRNDSNYQGYVISKDQAEELVDLWKTVGKEITLRIRSKL